MSVIERPACLPSDVPAVEDTISPNTLKRRPWHAFQANGRGLTGSRNTWVVEVLVPLLIVVFLLAIRAFVMASAVAGVAVVICLVRALSPVGRRWIDQGTNALAHWVGQGVATLVLAPAFYLVATSVRLVNRLTGLDPLHLRSGDVPTFWVPSDVESRRVRYVKSMFCTERLVQKRFTLLPLVLMVVAGLVVAEIGLRLCGLAAPLLYVEDPEIGYYPKPHQSARQPGRTIKINNYGMRSPDIVPRKAPGHFRILLLGDSTLAGTRVSNEELYSSLLQSNLNATAGGQVFEVLNMGVNGWGPFHEFGYVRRFGALDADLAVVCGPVFNCQRPLYWLERTPYYPAAHPPRLALERILFDLCWWYRARSLGPPAWMTEDQRRRGVEAWAELARLLQGQGVEVVFEMLPSKDYTLGLANDEPGRQMAAQIAERMGQLGVAVDCAGPIFKSAKPAEKVYHDICHFDRLGHRLYAAYLTQRLSEISPRLKKALAEAK
jgi:hypothetical protein